MTTSGVSTFTENRNQIIYAALRKLGAIAAGETPTAQTVQDCSDQLNSMIKALVASGIHIWTESQAMLFTQPYQTQYAFGSGTTDHCADTTTTQPVITTATNYTASGSSTIVCDTVVGMSSGDYFGVVLNTGYNYWTTINGAPNTTTNTVTLTSPLTDYVQGGAQVYTYTTNILRPLRVPSARSYVYASQIDTPMLPLSRQDYWNMPNKNDTGTITQFFYDPRGGANPQGFMFLWPAPSDATRAVRFTWYRYIQDFVTSSNTPDLPQEWIDTLVWNLAKKMAPEFDCPPQRYQMIVGEAASSLDLVTGWDREPESTYFGVDFSQRGYN